MSRKTYPSRSVSNPLSTTTVVDQSPSSSPVVVKTKKEERKRRKKNDTKNSSNEKTDENMDVVELKEEKNMNAVDPKKIVKLYQQFLSDSIPF